MKKESKIAITIRSFDEHGNAFAALQAHFDITYVNRTGERLTEDELCRILPDIDGVIAGTEPFTKKVIDASPGLRVISRVGIGLDSIDLKAAKSGNVFVKNTPDAPTLSVAEHTIALVFSVLKKIPQYNSQMREGNYSIELSSLLSGKKIGIVGLGRIGYNVAELAAALGCHIYYYDPFSSRSTPPGWVRTGTLEELLSLADILTLHASVPVGKKALLDAEAIRYCKKGQILINTARGGLVDEEALVKALDEGQISSAGLDVFPHEPYKGELLNYNQVITTPHVSSNTSEARQEMEMEAVINLMHAFEDMKR